MTGNRRFWHEKLDVYRLSLAFVSRTEDLAADCARPVAARDHLDRAGESVLENIVSGSSSHSPSVKGYHFAVAYGSALECAACLDIYQRRGLLQPSAWRERKSELRRIVQMLARNEIPGDCGEEGQEMLSRIATMLFAMRGYCEGKCQDDGRKGRVRERTR